MKKCETCLRYDSWDDDFRLSCPDWGKVEDGLIPEPPHTCFAFKEIPQATWDGKQKCEKYIDKRKL